MMYKNIVLAGAAKKKIVLQHAGVTLGLQLILDNPQPLSLTPTIETRASELQDMIETEYPTHSCAVLVAPRKLKAVVVPEANVDTVPA
jgi:hypothetical protein